MNPRDVFKKGARVKLSKAGYNADILCRRKLRNKEIYGTVHGFSRNDFDDVVRIVIDGRSEPESYHMSFWELNSNSEMGSGGGVNVVTHPKPLYSSV
jgi:hypothetical protein